MRISIIALIVFILITSYLISSCQSDSTDISKEESTGITTKNPVSISIDSILNILKKPSYTIEDTIWANRLYDYAEQIHKGDPERAISVARKAKEIYENAFPTSNSKIGEIYNIIGLTFYHNNDFPNAKENFELAINVYSSLDEFHPEIANIYVNIANIFNKKSDFDSSVQILEQAKMICEKNSNTSNEVLARIYLTYGNLFNTQKKYADALENYEKVVTYCEELPLLKSKTLSNIGTVNLSLENFDAAIQKFEEAIFVFPENSEERKTISLNTSPNLSIAYHRKGNFSRAIDYSEQGLRNALENPNFPQHHFINIYFNLANPYIEKGEYNRGLEYLFNALSLVKKYFGERHPNVGLIQHNLGLVFYYKNDLKSSLEYLNKSVNNLKNHERFELELASVYYNIGSTHRESGQLDSALFYQRKSLEINLRLTGSNSLATAQSYNGLGIAYSENGDYQKAKDYLNKALNLRKSKLGEKHPDVAKTYILLGKHYTKLDHFDKAIEHSNKAQIALGYNGLDFLQYVNDFRVLTAALVQKLDIFIKEYKTKKDIGFLKKSYELGQELLQVIDYNAKKFNPYGESFFEQEFNEAFEKIIQINYWLYEETNDEKYLREAFIFSERAKVILLSVALQETEALNFSSVPDSLILKENDLRMETTNQINERRSLLQKGISRNDTSVLKLSNTIFSLNQEYKSFVQFLNKEYPDYYKAKFDLSTLSLDKIQNNFLEADQGLLEYYVGEKNIFIFAARPDTFLVKKIELDFQLDTLIKELREGIYNTSVLLIDQTDQYTKASHELYKKLFQPVEDIFPKESKITVIPDNKLGYIPFDILMKNPLGDLNTKDTFPYLINDYQFSYGYSMTLQKAMKEKQHKRIPKKKLLAVAPYFSGDSSSQKLIAIRSSDTSYINYTLGNLKYNISEAISIRDAVGGDTLTRSAATEATFVKKAGLYQILHLATHGIVNSRSGDYSFLAFHQTSDSIENEYLYNRELYNLRLNADMVVLSACETGIGEIKKGEGIISLARGFSYAGAKSIITTLWSIDDQETPELMKFFYENLKEGMTKDAALRKAKLKFMKKNPEPFYWAAFIPIGDMQPIDFSTRFPWWGWMLIGLGIIIIFYWFIHSRK